MNSKYIKRQLTLNDIGIPMSSDIQEYYDAFEQVVGNIDDLEKRISGQHTYWIKDDTPILFYKSFGDMLIDMSIISRFSDKFDISYEESIITLEYLLEHFLKIEIIHLFSSSMENINSHIQLLF